MLYFKQGVRELYELNVQFLTFFYKVLSWYIFFNAPLSTAEQMASLVCV